MTTITANTVVTREIYEEGTQLDSFDSYFFPYIDEYIEEMHSDEFEENQEQESPSIELFIPCFDPSELIYFIENKQFPNYLSIDENYELMNKQADNNGAPYEAVMMKKHRQILIAFGLLRSEHMKPYYEPQRLIDYLHTISNDYHKIIQLNMFRIYYLRIPICYEKSIVM